MMLFFTKEDLGFCFILLEGMVSNFSDRKFEKGHTQKRGYLLIFIAQKNHETWHKARCKYGIILKYSKIF